MKKALTTCRKILITRRIFNGIAVSTISISLENLFNMSPKDAESMNEFVAFLIRSNMFLWYFFDAFTVPRARAKAPQRSVRTKN